MALAAFGLKVTERGVQRQAAEVDAESAAHVGQQGFDVQAVLQLVGLAVRLGFGAADHEVHALEELHVVRLAAGGGGLFADGRGVLRGHFRCSAPG